MPDTPYIHMCLKRGPAKRLATDHPPSVGAGMRSPPRGDPLTAELNLSARIANLVIPAGVERVRVRIQTGRELALIMDQSNEITERLSRSPQRRSGSYSRVLPVGLLAAIVSVVFAAPAVAAPTWLAPTELSAGGHDASEPAVAMDEAGETVAVWQRQSESEIGEVVQGSTRSPGHAFSAPFELAAASSEPALAMTPSGEAVAVWRHFDLAEAGDYEVQAAYRAPGGGFSTPLDVANTPNSAIPQDIQVAVDASGDTAVVWTQQEPGATSVVKASVRPAGGAFTTPSTISPTPVVSGHSARDPRVGIDAAGEVVAVWTYEKTSEEDVVQTARAPLSGGFSEPVELSPSGRSISPAIAISPGGEATAAWSRSNGTDYVVEVATASPGAASPLRWNSPTRRRTPSNRRW